MVCKFLISESTVGEKIPILCNQEHFLLKANSYKICQALQDFHCFIKPAVKNSHDKGRPRGGLFIAVPEKMKNIVIDVSPNFWRLQAVIIKNPNSNILVINSYFPVDPRTQNFDAAELLETLEFIRNIINDNDFTNLLWIGDINCDLVRRSGHNSKIKDFSNESSLQSSWEKYEVDFTHSQTLNDTLHTSVVDHVIWNEAFDEAVEDAGVIHLPENSSDHEPIYCVVDSYIERDPPVTESTSVPEKPSWKRATKEQKDYYSCNLEAKLSVLNTPESITGCQNVHCKDADHFSEADEYIIDILNSVEVASYEALPIGKSTSKSSKYKSMPGWFQSVKNLRGTLRISGHKFGNLLAVH